MSTTKKQVRHNFRAAVFERDKYTCRVCGNDEFSFDTFDAHHISNRNEMPNGGYVIENGITVCSDCHLKAEMTMNSGAYYPSYSPDDLYRLIGSSKEIAIAASRLLKCN